MTEVKLKSTQKQVPFGDDNQKGKGKSRSFDYATCGRFAQDDTVRMGVIVIFSCV